MEWTIYITEGYGLAVKAHTRYMILSWVDFKTSLLNSWYLFRKIHFSKIAIKSLSIKKKRLVVFPI